MSIVHFIASLIHALLRAAASSLVAFVGAAAAVLAIIAVIIATGCGLCGIGGLGLAVRKRRKDS